MMYSEFIDRTSYGEKYITESMYHDYIEPAYMAAPDSINKDIFCKDFYKLETQVVSTTVEGLIIGKTMEEKENYISGGNNFEDIEADHKILLQIFLKAFRGMYKEYCRQHYKK